jgi:hypothetical protein
MRLEPRHRRLHVGMLVALAALIGLGVAHAAGAAATGAVSRVEAWPRVRSSHPYIRAMIDEAMSRSPTFSRLVGAIEATDGILYVEQGDCHHSVRACLIPAATLASDFRILRVLVDSRKPDWEVMSSIGHELQHALEVLSDRGLTTAEAIYLFYSRQHATIGDTFETGEAVRAGDAVRGEVASFARRKVSP